MASIPTGGSYISCVVRVKEPKNKILLLKSSLKKIHGHAKFDLVRFFIFGYAQKRLRTSGLDVTTIVNFG